MKTGWLKKRQTKYTAYAATYIVVVLAVLSAANFLANRYNKSYDATANKQFSLSDQTLKVVRNLNRDVKITYFDESTRFPQARDLLDRYKTLSTKLTVEYIDPVRKPQVARAAGFRRDAPILVDSGVRKEEAKSLTEEEVTGALIRSLKTGERTACFVAGSGEHGIDDTGRSGYSSLKEALERNNYKVRGISLLKAGGAADAAAPATAKPEVPKDCTVLVVGGPKYGYTQPAVDAIQAYVENGGRVLVMLDPPLSVSGDETSPNEELSKVLESWGVVPQKDLALDTSGIGQIFGLGPEVPLITNYESHAIVREMRETATAFPLARTLEVKAGAKGSAEKLFSTAENSYATNKLAANQIRIDTKNDRKGPLTLAAAGTTSGTTQGRFVVVGSSLWAANSFLRFNGNRDLMLNMVNWLTSDEDLISIRPKEAQNQPLNITGQKMSLIFWLSVVLLPMAVIGSGLVTWWRRR
ncbi:MAG TPA: GldG family protein [Bryobacteraceae bacterium]|nr:GldG family protein [Bryobacteraceae bacterium]